MRIKEIHLPAYGCFTDYSIEFDDDKDFCLIYGANEAGKSTLLHALLDLFYDIPKNTPYSYKHGTPIVGATIMLSNGRAVSYQKKKGSRKIHLLNQEGNETNEIEKLKNEMQREVFVNMFGLDHSTLRAGGEALAQGKGRLAESIFMAASGINNLEIVLQKLSQQGDKLYRPRGKTQVINALVTQYRSKKAEIRDVSNKIEDFEFIKDKHMQLGQELNELADEIRKERLEQKRLERIENLVPRVKQYESAVAEREQIGEIVYLPAAARDERIEAQTALSSALSLKQDLKNIIQNISKKTRLLHIPVAFIENKENIMELQQELEKYRTNIAELPGLESQLRNLERNAREKLQMLNPDMDDLQEAGKLRLSLEVEIHIKQLVKEWHSIKQDIAKINEHIQEKQKQIAEKERIRKSLPGLIDTSKLQNIIDNALARGGLEKTLLEQQRYISVQEKEFQNKSALLSLYQGKPADLLSIKLPLPETVNRWEIVFTCLEEDLKNLGEEKNRIKTVIDQTEARLKTDIGEAKYTEKELNLARNKREEGWQLIRRILNNDRDIFAEKEFAGDKLLEDVYAMKVQEADTIADFLREKAEIMYKNKSLTHTVNENKAKYEEIKQVYEQNKEKYKNEWMKWENEWSGAKIEKVLSPREMRQWLQIVQGLQDDLLELEDQRSKADSIKSEIKDIKNSLHQCLAELEQQPMEDNISLALMLSQCRYLIKKHEQNRQTYNNIIDSTRELLKDLEEWKNQRDGSERDLKEWESRWAAATSKIPATLNYKPDIVEEYMQVLNEMLRLLGERDEINERIIQSQKYIRSFKHRADKLMELVQSDFWHLQVDQAVQQMVGIYNQANDGFITLKQLENQLEGRISEYTSVLKEIKTLKCKLRQLLERAKCNTVEELEQKEVLSDRAQQLDQQIKSIKAEIQENLAGSTGTLAQVISELKQVDLDIIAVKVNEIEDKLKILEEKQYKLMKEYGAVEDEYNKMLRNTSEQAARAAQDAEDLLAGIQVRVDEYIKYNLAYKILAQSIQVYSDKNQADIIKKAGDIFAVLTLNSFAGITIGYDEDHKQIIMGIRSSGEEIKLEAMSDGTLDQLYLALRLANIQQYLAHNRALPLIMDDLLINFDDERARATLGILKKIAGKTQVIFFTHHNHLKQLAHKELNGCIQVRNIKG